MMVAVSLCSRLASAKVQINMTDASSRTGRTLTTPLWSRSHMVNTNAFYVLFILLSPEKNKKNKKYKLKLAQAVDKLETED